MKRLLLCLMLVTIAPAMVLAQRLTDAAARQPFDPRTMPRKTSTSGPQIFYHGGPIMTGKKNHIYVIYYGDFALSTTNIIDTFLENLGGSGAYNVNSTYYNAQNQSIQDVLAYNRATDSYNDLNSMGSKLTGSFAAQLLQSALSSSALPTDSEAIYLEIISPQVAVSNTNYCGYHTHSTSVVTGQDIKYAVVPDPDPKHYDCSGNVAVFGDTTSPNGDIGADSVCDTLIHEISETVTDPDLNAWYGPHGENGDLCNFVYGTTFTATNGSHYNQTFGGLQYLVQTIWENTGNGFCANSLP
jgi:phosphate-induced protein 1